MFGHGLDPAADMQFFADFFDVTAHGFAADIQGIVHHFSFNAGFPSPAMVGQRVPNDPI